MRRLFLLCSFIYCGFIFTPAQGVNLKVAPIFEGIPLIIDEESDGNQSIIQTFKCYLTAFEFIQDGNVVWQEKKSYHLIDASDSSSLELMFRMPEELNYDHISFTLGVDSLTSVSGAMGGDLDPTKGMYWTWNSGYVNFKLEGYHPNAHSKELRYEFHLGGYLPPFQTAQKLILPCSNSSEMILEIDLDAFLASLEVQEFSSVMSAGKKAHELSLKAAPIFSLLDAK